MTDPALLPLSSSCNSRLRTDEEFIRIMTKAVNELGLEWSPPEQPSRSRLDEWFLPGRHQAPRQRSSPFFPEVHDELTKSWRTPTRLASVFLPPLPSPEEKEYECLPPLDESVAAHLCPPTTIAKDHHITHRQRAASGPLVCLLY